jgi:hypothetical protein
LIVSELKKIQLNKREEKRGFNGMNGKMINERKEREKRTKESN